MTTQVAQQTINEILLSGTREETSEYISRTFTGIFTNASQLKRLEESFRVLGAKVETLKKSVGQSFSIETEGSYLSFTYKYSSSKGVNANNFWVDFTKNK